MSKLRLSFSSQVSNRGKTGFHTYHSAPNMKEIGKLFDQYFYPLKSSAKYLFQGNNAVSNAYGVLSVVQEATSPSGSECVFPTTLLAMADLRYKSAELRIGFSFLSLPLGEDAFLDENLQMSHCLMLSAVFFVTSIVTMCIVLWVHIYFYMAMNNAR